MSGRELVILLLGLAIVAVVLRGLYVAINARRGQIKLAIDKNIPQDVDLESLEMAELPGGGARVVTRSLEEVNRQNSALDLAETKARSLNLADSKEEAHIPVLMDAVELTEPELSNLRQQPQSQRPLGPEEAVAAESAFTELPAIAEEESHSDEEQDAYLEEELEDELEEDFTHAAAVEHSLGEDWEDDEDDVDEPEDQSAAHLTADDDTDDADTVLLDYEDEEFSEGEHEADSDPMRSVAPDYSAESDEAEDSDEIADDDSYAEGGRYDARGDQSESAEQELTEDAEREQSPAFDADSSADNFSMTAGERIGENRPVIAESSQSSLFDELGEDEPPVTKKENRTLFSMFGRKSKRRQDPDEVAEPITPVINENVEEEAAIDEPDDVLLSREQPQAESEEAPFDETESFESAFVEAVHEEEPVDELNQKRTASQEQTSEPKETHTEEIGYSEVLVLNVTAKEGRVFAGEDLLHVLITAGLKFGDMNIFHKRLSKEHQSTVVFSVANMLNPGTFDLNNMDDFTTLGISFFLALPSPINNLDAFEQMLGVAQQIRGTLDGDLKDDHRNGMTGQTVEHYRQRVRDFELRRLKAVAARG